METMLVSGRGRVVGAGASSDRLMSVSVLTGKLIAQVKQSLSPKPVWEISFDDIEDLVLVDSGGYGNVYLGKYLHMDVAVKRLKKSQLRDLEAFKVEIGMMRLAHFVALLCCRGVNGELCNSKLRHPNIVLFLGATTSPLSIVTEYMSRKSMFDVIHDSSVVLNSRCERVRVRACVAHCGACVQVDLEDD